MGWNMTQQYLTASLCTGATPLSTPYHCWCRSCWKVIEKGAVGTQGDCLEERVELTGSPEAGLRARAGRALAVHTRNGLPSLIF